MTKLFYCAGMLLRRHSWSMQGRAASGQVLPSSPGAMPPPTPPSPQYSPRYPQARLWALDSSLFSHVNSGRIASR